MLKDIFRENSGSAFQLALEELPARSRGKLFDLWGEVTSSCYDYRQNFYKLFMCNIFRAARQDFPNLPEKYHRIYSACSRYHTLFKRQQKSAEANELPTYSQCLEFRATDYLYFPLRREDLFNLLPYCENRAQRKKIYQAHQNLGKTARQPHYNVGAAQRVLRAREKFYHASGYKESLHKLFTGKFETSPACINNFLEESLEEITPTVKENFSRLVKFGQSEYNIKKMQPWDFEYLRNEWARTILGYDPQEFGKYFELNDLLPKLLSLIERVFSLKLTPIRRVKNNPGVEYLVMDQRSMTRLGILNLSLAYDPASNNNDQCYASYDTIEYAGGRGRRPETLRRATITDNLIKETSSPCCFLSFFDFKILFHEMGHALEYIISAGLEDPEIEFEPDLTEFSSLFLEKFCFFWPTVKSLSSHYHTGRPVPHSLYTAAVQEHDFNNSFHCLFLITKSLVDLNLNKPGARLRNTIKEVCAQTQYNKFGFFNPFIDHHIFNDPELNNYTGNVYTYLLSEIIAADFISALAPNLTPEELIRTGAIMRQKVWEQLGRAQFSDIYKEVVGKKFRPGVIGKYRI